MPAPLPLFLNKYFWDVRPNDIDLQKNSSYIAERLLELGDFKEINWLLKTYGEEFLRQIVGKSRNLSLKSANFYSLYFGINPKDIICLQGDYRQQHKTIWRH